MDNTQLNELIEPLIAQCSPLQVAVKLKCIKDRYYIHFDGSKTFNDPDEWELYWHSFEKYVVHVLNSNNFDSSSITVKDKVHAVAFVGTLFGFLVKETKK